MAGEKQARKKGKKVFWVLTQKDTDIFVRQYSGPDKGRARDVAEKYLRDNSKDSVIVAKISALRVLDVSHLESSLPKEAF